jgi:hypothetical protein
MLPANEPSQSQSLFPRRIAIYVVLVPVRPSLQCKDPMQYKCSQKNLTDYSANKVYDGPTVQERQKGDATLQELPLEGPSNCRDRFAYFDDNRVGLHSQRDLAAGRQRTLATSLTFDLDRCRDSKCTVLKCWVASL